MLVHVFSVSEKVRSGFHIKLHHFRWHVALVWHQATQPLSQLLQQYASEWPLWSGADNESVQGLVVVISAFTQM